MIYQPKRLKEQEVEGIFRKCLSYLSRKYWRMDEQDDCQNLLSERLPVIVSSAGFYESEYPAAYLRKSLLNAGERFYQTRLRQIENSVTNQNIVELSREHGVFRDCANRHDGDTTMLTLDVAKYTSMLSREDRILCEGVMADDSSRKIASQLGISHDTANKKRQKFLSSARQFFRSYE